MCTVSYVPLQDGYIITSNRDETPSRSVCEIATEEIDGVKVHFPKDPAAGGSWFAFAESGHVACLLNGAYEPFDMSLQFPRSRGRVLIESFGFESVDDFVEHYQFEGVAPFTLILIRDSAVHQIIWDDNTINHMQLDPGERHFWSSVTLYPKDVRAWRRELFETWSVSNTHPRQTQIMSFHRFGGKGDNTNDFVMNRSNIVRTLSITSVHHTDRISEFRHEDLLDPGRSRHIVIEHAEPLAQPS